jgi:acyl-coenzyme A thioesterase PaaI-like protein
VLEAWNWRVLERGIGLLEVECDLPEHLKNPQGQLFGGFTPTYVDFVAIHTMHSLDPEPPTDDPEATRAWMVTINMRCDYFEPIMGPTFVIRGELINQRGLTSLVATSFYQREVMAAHAITTLRMVPGVTVPARSP